MNRKPWLHGNIDPFNESDAAQWVELSTPKEKRAFVYKVLYEIAEEDARRGIVRVR